MDKKYKNIILIIIHICILLFIFLLKLSPVYFESADFNAFLKPWFKFIIENNGFGALRYDFYNYNPPYIYLLVAMYYTGIKSAFLAVKFLGIIFDIILALTAGNIVFLITKKKLMLFLTQYMVLLLPTVFLNSGVWGQADNIYTSFILLCILLCMRVIQYKNIHIKYYIGIGLLFGLAIAFKLQAIFFLPVLFVFGLQQRKLLIIIVSSVISYLLMLIPAVVAGRDMQSLLSIYINQSQTYHELTKNAPTIWAFIQDNQYDWYSFFYPSGLLLPIIVVMIGFFIRVFYDVKIKTIQQFLLLSALCVLIVPYLTPKMHERYFYIAEVLTALLPFINIKYFPIPVLLSLTTVSSYLDYLFTDDQMFIPLKWGALLIAVAIALLIYYLYDLFKRDGFFE